MREIMTGSADGDGWQDGAELSRMSDKNLVKTVNGRTVTKISVRKYRCGSEWAGVPQKYKYVVEIERTKELLL